MNFEFFWTEKSQKRNKFTCKDEPLQPLLLLEYITALRANTFFDIGANIGFYSILMTLSPSIRSVYSFEASRDTFNELEANVQLNDLGKKIILVEKAVSSSNGFVNFQTESELSGINCIAETSFHRPELFKKTSIVESIKIDDLISLENENIAFKIDVEGHEKQVLEGAKKTLINNQCVIQVEIYREQDTVRFLEICGYKKFFRVMNDYYFTNSNFLIENNLDILESAVDKFTNHSIGNWPPKKSNDYLFVDAYLDGNKIVASCNVDTSIFCGNNEFAFYIYFEGKRISIEWYTDNPSLVFEIPVEYIGKSISVTAFVRDKDNQSKKLAKNVVVI